MSELESLFVTEKTVKIGKGEVVVKQLTVDDLPKILQIMMKVMPEKNKTFDLKAAVQKIVTDHFEEVKLLLVSLTNIETEKVGKLNLAAASMIIAEVLKENVDFLYQHVVPAIQGLTDSINQKSPTDGSGKSKN